MPSTHTVHLNPGPGPDPLHCDAPAHTNWSRNNIAEALPGICTALGFTFWFEPNNLGVLRGFRAVGACRRSEVRMPARPEDFILGAFYGQAAINLSAQQPFFDRVPLYSTGTMEEVMLSKEGERHAKPKRRSILRFRVAPVTKLLWTASLLPRKQSALRRRTHRWWRGVVGVGKPYTMQAAVETIVEAHGRFERIMEIHLATGLIMGLLYARLAELVAVAGHPGLESKLATGANGIDETEVLNDLWEVAHGQAGLDDFIGRHGFHGPAEGQISEPSWREAPSLLDSLIDEMRRRPEDDSPGSLQRAREQARRAAERDFLARLSLAKRLQARFLLGRTRLFLQLRETSKASFLRAIDAARFAARGLGERLATAKLLDSAEDIFHLTYAEIAAPGFPGDPRALRGTAARRAKQRAEYLNLELPFSFNGVPQPLGTQSPGQKPADHGLRGVQPADAETGVTAAPEAVTGMGVSQGVAEGRVRVLTTPGGDARIASGEILVCPTTDPSWAGLLMLASGAVIDMGGSLSHGAVVARELGIPCVMNTVNGTKRLRTGDKVRLDGSTGIVEILGANAPDG